jgi:signal transduction histidine kinase
MMIAAAPPTLEALTLQVTAALVQTAGYAVADCWELRDGRLVLMGLNGNPYSPVELPLTRGVCAQVAKSGIPLLAPNVKDVDFLGADDMPPSEDLRHMILPPLSGPLVSEMCVPIFNDNRVVLVLNVEHTERLRQRDLQLLLDVAAQVTLALEHVRLVSEVQRVQADLARAARMASIGTLAAGVAHEFNNLLAAMVGYAQLGLGGTHEDQVEALQVVEQAGRRGKHITSSLLAFAETGSAQRTITRLGDLADRALLLLEPGLRDQGIALERAYSDEAVVRSDQPQLTQAISNLVSNACDAMPDGGTLTIRTAVAPGWATLSVIDTGHGIDPAVRNHIFEPFVTTKGALGGGSLGGAGLGLAICYGIVQRHGGTIDVQSAVRRGSTFTLRLPLSTTEATPPQGAGSTALRVLVVDRDPVMQALLRATLTRAGYDVIVAADGAGVRVRLRQGGIDALICAASPHDDEDPEIVAQLRAAGNLLPVVFVSSRVEATPVWAQGAEGSTPMVNPFQPDEVIAAVQMATSGRTRWG